MGRAGTTTKRDLRQSAVLSAVCALLRVVATGRSGSIPIETRKAKKPVTIVESILQVEEPLSKARGMKPVTEEPLGDISEIFRG